jgi:phosphoglycolate phosphatase
MDNYTAAYPEISRRHTSLVPGMAELLQHLSQDHALGIVTSKYTETAADVLDHFGLSSCFVSVVGSDLTVALKPEAAPLVALCEVLGVSPTDVVMFGDASVDMKMASAAGAVGIGVTWGTASAEELWEAGASEVISAIDATFPALARVMARRRG